MWFLITAFLTVAEAASTETVSITVDAKTTEFLLLASGSRLDFPTPGPKRILIESRRRMAGAAQRSRSEPIIAEGDGNLILTIRVPGTSIPSGKINDRLGGFPSKADKSNITVPEGGQVLSLEAPVGGPDFLVRVVDRTWPDRLVLPISSGAAMADNMPDPNMAAQEPSASSVDAGKQKQKNEEDHRLPGAPDILNPAVGLAIGLGLPARGDNIVTSVQALGRYPLYKELISAGASLGWHRISVDEQVAVSDPLSGDITYIAQWATNIVPLTAHANIHVPFPAGPITPLANAGIGLYIATRSERNNRVTNASVGPTAGIGAEMEFDFGEIQAMFNWQEARAKFGNQSLDGSVVRESLAVTQINLAYMYVF